MSTSQESTGRQPAFWIIWNPMGGPPAHRHYSQESATREAERLAAENPGATFIVLASVCGRRAGPMERIDLSEAEPDDLPF